MKGPGKTLILHGWGGSDHPHWQAWLAGELAKDYGTVSFPLIQHPHFPHINRWKKEILAHLDDFGPDTVVCHSLANTLWFHLCREGLAPKLQNLVLVSPPRLNCTIETLRSFFPAPLPKTLNADKAILVVSDNDPYLTMDEAWSMQEALGIPMKVVERAGHINAESGYGPWPWILQYLTKGELCPTQ